jgi:acyl-homoserine lactone acylase PvdQ
VTILRDKWGIPHVYGKSDADAVFGLMYAQAEDDFHRVELNFINAMGRLAEVEGEAELYRDLRMKLFINPDELRRQYAQAPAWLKKLMVAWADGLNYYLQTHPAVKPALLTHFEPWMALSFSEGSIGGDIETVDIKQLQALYADGAKAAADAADADVATTASTWTGAGRFQRLCHRALADQERPCAADDQSAHLVLLSSRSAGAQRRGPERLWRRDLGPVLRLPGLQ